MLLTFLAKQTNKKLLFAGPCGVTSQARASLKVGEYMAALLQCVCKLTDLN